MSLRRVSVVVAAVIAAAVVPAAAPATTSTLADYPVPFASSAGPGFYDATVGPDGNIWFSEQIDGQIGRITPDGVLTEFPAYPPGAPTCNSGPLYMPSAITAGVDGDIYFAFSDGCTLGIARMTTGGVVTVLATGGHPLYPGGAPRDMVLGADGNVWFGIGNDGPIGTVTPQGQVSQFFLPSSSADQFTLGGDGNVWFTTLDNRIGKITPAGAITIYPLPPGSSPNDITAGTDGAIWWADDYGSVGRITTNGNVTMYPLNATRAYFIDTGPDGKLYVVTDSALVSMTTGGAVAPVAGSPGTFPLEGTIFGPDGSIWGSDWTGAAANIIRLDLHPDSTPPIVTGAPDRAANANGWYAGDVTVHWSASDPDSTASTPPDTLAQLEGTHTYTSGQSCDPSNNCATGSLSLSIDQSDPLIGGSASPAANANGWNKTAVTVSFACHDLVSGIDSCSSPVTLAAEGAGQSVTGTAVDKAGRGAQATVSPINIDLTDPTISGAASPAANTNGWNKTPVTVSFSCGDALSGIDSCSSPATLGGEGVGESVTGTAVDKAGRSSQATVSGIKIDLTDPLVSCQPASFLLNQTAAVVSASVSDSLSGPEQATVSAAVATGSVGSFTVNLTGRDNAGRQTTTACPYTVGYQFSGLNAPVGNPPTNNAAKAGQTIPIKWRLTDANGTPVSDPASFSSLSSSNGSCTGGGLDDVETYSGGSGLQYVGDGNWQFNWKTPTSYTGQCRIASLNLTDGSHHQAKFQFK